MRPARSDTGTGTGPDDTPTKGKRATPEQKSEARLLEIMELGAVNSRLVEAAETAAAIGGVYIYPVWDKDLRDFPIMAIAQADQAVPEFRYGLLTAVTFSRVVAEESGNILRHLERHEVEGTGDSRRAVVLHGLYRGTSAMLGSPIDLVAAEATQALPARVELPFADLDVEYIPNIRPNRLWRASGHGVADIQGSETLLDALDETYASWMRDVRLAKARIIVPREYLATDQDGKNAAFDIDQEIYVGMEMDPGLTQDARAMLAHQFNIRWLEHKGTGEALIDRIVSNAGYATSTLGAAQAASAASSSLRIGEHKTILTLKRKSAWWEAAVANVLYRMMLIDKEIFGSKAPVIRPVVTLADSIIDTPLELAQTTLAMKTAESASIETRVRIQHSDWSEAEVDAEVLRIKDELEAAKPPVAVSAGAFGNPKDDAAATGKKPLTGKGPAPTNKPPTTAPQAKNAG